MAKKVGLLASLLLFLKKGWIIITAAVGGLWKLKKGKDKKKKNQEYPNLAPPDPTPDQPNENEKNII